MRAMVQTDPGGPEAVFPQDVPEPTCGPRVVVDDAYRELICLDLPRIEGPGPTPGSRRPHLPGTDFAGTAVATRSAVGPVVPGDRGIAGPNRSLRPGGRDSGGATPFPWRDAASGEPLFHRRRVSHAELDRSFEPAN
ncbi:hypothetical protein ACWEFL_06070 [Streptomyces sp. NPDC004838]